MADRLWQFNPGCPEEECCGEGEDCGQLCITLTAGNTTASDSPEGFTLNGGEIGTCTTDSGGECCLDISDSGPGVYTFTASKTGYHTVTFDVEVTEEDCDGSGTVSKDGPRMLPTTIPNGCYEIRLLQCGPCPRGGTALTLTASDSSWTVTLTTDPNGRIRYCPPDGTFTNVSVFIPSDGGPQADTTRIVSLGVLNKVGTVIADLNPYWFCFPGYPYHCMGPFPTALTVNFTLPQGSQGVTTYECAQILNGGLRADYLSPRYLTDVGIQTWSEFEITITRTTTVCGGANGFPTITLRQKFYSNFPDTNPTVVREFGSPLPISGTLFCPVNYIAYQFVPPNTYVYSNSILIFE
jgi:hypothetical protein